MTNKFRNAYDDEPTTATAPTLADNVFGEPSQKANISRRPAIVPQANGEMIYKRFVMTPVGLIVPADVKPEELLDIGAVIFGLQTRIQWIAGDLLNSMEKVWGKSYQEIAANLGYEVRTVQEWASICKRVSIRIEALSFGHHQLVAGKSDQEYWLNQAVEHNWSIAELRSAMKEKRPAPQLSTKRIKRDFEDYWEGLDALGQGGRAELRQLAYNLIMQIDSIDPLEGSQ